MSNILITYCSNAGSTAQVAQRIAEKLAEKGHTTHCVELSQADNLEAYDAVLLGAPMILGWHSRARQFLRKHRSQLSGKKVALFATLLNLTQPTANQIETLNLYLDPQLPVPAQNPQRLTIKERYALAENYVKPMRSAAGALQPLQIAFFGGKLDIGKLNFFQMLFVLAIIQAKPGDFRNWNAVDEWAAQLHPRL